MPRIEGDGPVRVGSYHAYGRRRRGEDGERQAKGHHCHCHNGHRSKRRELLQQLREEGHSPKEYLAKRVYEDYAIDLDRDYPDISGRGVVRVVSFLMESLDVDEDSDYAEKLAALRHQLEKAERDIRVKPHEL